MVEESDSDSDEDLDGGVRYDFMMIDEKVKKKIINIVGKIVI